jgi:small subunit ribosomal protein S3
LDRKRVGISNPKSSESKIEGIMGQKVHPYGFRVGYNKDWHSHWYAKKEFSEFLAEDLKLKRDLKRRFTGAGVSHIDVERAANRLKIIIYTSRPGIIIGRKGSEIEKLKEDLSKKTGREVIVSIQEITKPELNAQLQAEKIAQQLEKRIAFRRAMKKDDGRIAALRSPKGDQSHVRGPLERRWKSPERNGVWRPSTAAHPRADIDYGFSEAITTFGIIGVKVWIYRGEISIRMPRWPAERRPIRSTNRVVQGGGRGDRRRRADAKEDDIEDKF